MSLSESLKYNIVPNINPQYKFNPLIPQSGSQVIPLTAGGGQEITFEIPVTAFNLSKSFLSFDMILPEAGDGDADHEYIITYRDVLSVIRTIQLYTISGIYLCDLNYVNNMTKIVNKAETNLNEFLSYDTALATAALPTINANGQASVLRRSNLLSNNNSRYDGSVSEINYTENLYVDISAIADDVGAGNLCYKYNIQLSQIKNTIFELDKLLYVGENLVLRIIIDGLNKIAYANQDESAAGVNLSPYPIVDQAVLAGFPLQLSNMTLYLAIEKNKNIVSTMHQTMITKGFEILIPFTTAYYNTLTGTNHTLTLKFNRGNGRKLVKVYDGCFQPNPEENQAYDVDNINLIKISSLYSVLDNERLQEIDINCANGDDYMILKDQLKGSVIQTSNIYNYNHFWVDDFSQRRRLYDRNWNEEVGLDINFEKKYEIYYTTAGSLDHYSYAIFQKLLTINSLGIFLK